MADLIRIGYRGENNARYADIDISALLEMWPDCYPTLVHKRKGDSDVYPVATELNGTMLRWTFSSMDSAVKGFGQAQVLMMNEDGSVLGKSEIYRTLTEDSLDTGKKAPVAPQNWVDSILAKVAESEKNAKKAEKSAEEASKSESSAEFQVGLAANRADQARQYAEQAAEASAGIGNVKAEAERATAEARQQAEAAALYAFGAGRS